MLSDYDIKIINYIENLYSLIEKCPPEKKIELYKSSEEFVSLHLGINININNYDYDGQDYNKYEIMCDVTKKALVRRTKIKDLDLEILEEKLRTGDRNNDVFCNDIKDLLSNKYNCYGIDLSPRYTNHEIIDKIMTMSTFTQQIRAKLGIANLREFNLHAPDA